jgi:hypothetical protein
VGKNLLQAACLGSKELAATNFVLNAIDVAAGHLVKNKDYYRDVLQYTFANGHAPINRTKIYFSDLPSEVSGRLAQLHKDKFYDDGLEEIFRKLNIPKTKTNSFSPLQGKYAYHYCKNYGTAHYSPEKLVSDEQLLRALEIHEIHEYVAMFS